jgi:hypothetical protein
MKEPITNRGEDLFKNCHSAKTPIGNNQTLVYGIIDIDGHTWVRLREYNEVIRESLKLDD